MARFTTTPPIDELRPWVAELPPQAGRPEDFAFPDVPASMPDTDHGGEDAPYGLPMIPAEHFAQGLEGDLPEEAELPDIFGL
jgi:hypothetical protein